MEKTQTTKIVGLVLKALAVAMPIGSIVLGFFPHAADVDTHLTLLGIGLLVLALATFMKDE